LLLKELLEVTLGGRKRKKKLYKGSSSRKEYLEANDCIPQASLSSVVFRGGSGKGQTKGP